MVLFRTHSKRFQTVCQFDFSFASRSAMNPIENNVLVRTCKMCFKRKKITPVLGSGEVFFQEPYQCISCCFKPVQVVQQRPESGSKINETKVDAKSNISLLRILQLGPEMQFKAKSKLSKVKMKVLEILPNLDLWIMQGLFQMQTNIRRIRGSFLPRTISVHFMLFQTYQRRIPEVPKRHQWFKGQSPTKKSEHEKQHQKYRSNLWVLKNPARHKTAPVGTNIGKT